MSTVYEIWWPGRALCLYVGVTDNLKRRLREHELRNPSWWSSPVDVRTTELASRQAAESLEWARIRALRPANNRRGIPDG